MGRCQYTAYLMKGPSIAGCYGHPVCCILPKGHATDHQWVSRCPNVARIDGRLTGCLRVANHVEPCNFREPLPAPVRLCTMFRENMVDGRLVLACRLPAGHTEDHEPGDVYSAVPIAF